MTKIIKLKKQPLHPKIASDCIIFRKFARLYTHIVYKWH